MTTAEQIFELFLQGADIPTLQEFNVPPLQLTAQLEPGKPLRLKVHVTDVPEQEADARAKKLAQELYSRFLVKFGGYIERSEPPRSVHKTFTGDVPRATVRLSGKSMGKATAIARLTAILPASDVNDLARDVELRVITTQIPTSAQLYTAIDMYTTGLESQNKVVRFLIFYSALSLAALFKGGKGGGGQQNVDKLILGINPEVSVSASPTKNNVTETLYTKLRNDLIHAEDRGGDPVGAIAAIEAHIKQFQGDVALVISHL
jgi:hypothetical protein